MPTSTPSAPAPPPAVADPSFDGLFPTPTPEPTAQVSTSSLAQPVSARRLGLPGALAAVLVVGVAVGVVRLAKAEYGTGYGVPLD